MWLAASHAGYIISVEAQHWQSFAWSVVSRREGEGVLAAGLVSDRLRPDCVLWPGELEKAKPEAEDGTSYMSGWDLPPSGSDSEQIEEDSQDEEPRSHDEHEDQVPPSASAQQPRQEAGHGGHHGEKVFMESELGFAEAGLKEQSLRDSAAVMEQGQAAAVNPMHSFASASHAASEHMPVTQERTDHTEIGDRVSGVAGDREADAAATSASSTSGKGVAAGRGPTPVSKASIDPSSLSSSEQLDAAGSSAVSRPVHAEGTSAEHGPSQQHHSQQHQHVADVRPAKVSEGEELIDVFRVHLGM